MLAAARLLALPLLLQLLMIVVNVSKRPLQPSLTELIVKFDGATGSQSVSNAIFREGQPRRSCRLPHLPGRLRSHVRRPSLAPVVRQGSDGNEIIKEVKGGATPYLLPVAERKDKTVWSSLKELIIKFGAI